MSSCEGKRYFDGKKWWLDMSIVVLKKLNYIFTKKEKQKIVLLFIVILISSFFEMLGVSLILPFANMIIEPGFVSTNQYLGFIVGKLGFTSDKQLIIFFAVLLIIIYLVKNMYLIFTNATQYHFIYKYQGRLASSLMNCYINQPYLFHAEKNIAELQRNIQVDVNMFCTALLAILQFITEMCVCLTLAGFLLFSDVVTTIGVMLVLMIALLFFFKVLKKKIGYFGQKMRETNKDIFKWIEQSFGGIKEVKVLNREDFFSEKFDQSYFGYADNLLKYQIYSNIPKPFMETMCVAGLLLVIIMKINLGENTGAFVPTLIIFGAAALRLLPSFNRMSANLSAILYNQNGIHAIYKDLKEAKDLKGYKDSEDRLQEEIKGNIEIQDLYFKYPKTDKFILEDLNLTIPVKTSVALIGASGAGKTTLADLILGILTPQKGSIVVNGQDIFENLKSWHHRVGYIPQNIYLMDDTIKRNIAFGIPEEEISENQLERAIEEAQLKKFIDELESGVNTYVGEKGIKLSGGQRQRIGIARALYGNPEVLVLDEATSALDNETEAAVMDAINILQGNKTLIIVAHRLSTIKNCDSIYEIKTGKAEWRDRETVLVQK